LLNTVLDFRMNANTVNAAMNYNEVGLQPIVLHRQPDEGLTIIEKFEKHSDVSFALLLTPDDVGCVVFRHNWKRR